LGDVTLRAIETLKSVDRVAAEDTRRTRGLLTHLGISAKPLVALEAHASARAIERLVQRLEQGENVAFVSDAGMPAVSDPGAALVRLATERRVPVVVVPGPSAVTAAVAASGLIDAPFRFFGFLPRRGRARRDAIARIASEPDPVVLFESPARITATLAELASVAPERSAALCRELTKLHEEILHGTLAQLAALDREWRGEITLVIGRASAPAAAAFDDAELDGEIAGRLAAGASAKEISAELASRSGRPRRDVYARVQLVKRGR
jgi:16S rRNA (cytidine1402-2'-O)-methyltransferase